jgi:hypothetical protein
MGDEYQIQQLYKLCCTSHAQDNLKCKSMSDRKFK